MELQKKKKDLALLNVTEKKAEVTTGCTLLTVTLGTVVTASPVAEEAEGGAAGLQHGWRLQGQAVGTTAGPRSVRPGLGGEEPASPRGEGRRRRQPRWGGVFAMPRQGPGLCHMPAGTPRSPFSSAAHPSGATPGRGPGLCHTPAGTPRSPFSAAAHPSECSIRAGWAPGRSPHCKQLCFTFRKLPWA